MDNKNKKILKTLVLGGTFLFSGLLSWGVGEGMAYRELPPQKYEDIARVNRYLSFYKQNPGALNYKGDHKQGELEVELDVEEIYKTQMEFERRYLEKGYSKEYAKQASRVGIISEDPHVYFVRDAIVLPNGNKALFSKAMQGSSLNGPNGVGILPVLPDGKMVLIVNFRNATRSWEVELIRGTREGGEKAVEAAHRELMEETGYRTGELKEIGTMAVDSAIVNTLIPIYFGEIEALEDSHKEESEAIQGTVALSKEELNKALELGYLETMVEGKIRAVPLRDPFLTYALYMAQIKGLI